MVIGEAAATACKRGEGKGGSDHGLRVSTMGGSASLGKHRSERSGEGDLRHPAVKMTKMAAKRSTPARFLRRGDEVRDEGASEHGDAARGEQWLRVRMTAAGCCSRTELGEELERGRGAREAGGIQRGSRASPSAGSGRRTGLQREAGGGRSCACGQHASANRQR